MALMESQDSHAVELLNADLYGEHDAILYYLTHAWTVARQHGHQILEIAYDEMRHFKWLAHTIVDLGGTPDLKPPDVAPVTDIQAALKKDVEAEIQAIDQYQDHIERISLKPVKALLQRIVVDEQDHLRQFRELLDQTHGEPEQVERPEKVVSRVATQLQQTIRLEYQQMLAYLMRSFMETHAREMGMDMEERSIDEMRHMGWIGKRMGMWGIQPKFPEVDIDEVAHTEEEAIYRDVREWAQVAMPSMLPTIDRILAQEEYHVTR
ncbi:ferritin-like domain-containing protein [Sulfobacillus harzensis]|uniref:Rubrerythrin n=1 Tax=Sulfobacillus harzensis TaxID=2729629 RepID=A0A7Y0L477_9FIRM|nr:ferritin-like domain-containing protein [Sulfobacillus harzensis]NMP22095.1 rubrerythrin [Sulfobacillus harzensis]